MSDVTAGKLAGESVEAVAYKLLVVVGEAEGKLTSSGYAVKEKVDRKWILDTFAECLDAAKGNRSYNPHQP